MLMGGVGMAYAASSDSIGTINVVAEITISSPELLNAAETSVHGSSLVVNTQYHANWTVSDTDGMDDVLNFTVRIWDSATSTENGTDDENNHYSIYWTGANTTWNGYPAGFLGTCSGSASAAITQYEFKAGFDLSKVADYENGGVYTSWKVSIFGYDTEGNSDMESECRNFGVAEYTEISGLAGTHSWASLAAGSSDNPVTGTPLTFTAIANRVWNATAKADVDPTTGAYSFGVGNVTVYDSNVAGSSIPLVITPSKVTIGTLGDKAVSNTEAGTACNLYMWVDIPAAQPPGAYVYTLTVTVEWAT